MLGCVIRLTLSPLPPPVFLGAGFFIKVQDEIWPVRWISYIVPTRYALNGLLDSLLAPNTYTTGYPAPNNVVSGAFLLQSVVGQPDDYNKWTDLGIVWAFVVGFRFAFLGQLFWGLRKYAAVKAGGGVRGATPAVGKVEVV